MSSEPFPGCDPDPRFRTIGYLPWMARGKNDPFPMSSRVLATGVPLPAGPFTYGMMKPARADAMRGAERFLDWPVVQFSPELVAAYIKLMFPELKGACRSVDLGEVIFNPRGTAGPSFRGMKMVQAIREHPDLIGMPHYRLGSKVLFKMAPKYEILAAEKLRTGTPRTFAFMDFHHRLRWTRLVQFFNQYIQTLKWSRPVSGSISLVDDWDDFWRALNQYVWKIINDFRKYDSGYPKLMHAAMLLVRLWACDSSVSSADKEELRYYYDSLQELMVVLPNGQVVFLDNGQISGQPSTTTDNSVVSAFMLDLAFSVIAWSNDLQKPITEELVHYALVHRHKSVDKLTRIKTGGDDSASATDMHPEKYREALDLVARMHGFAVKNEDFKVTRDITECGFLGGRACRREGRFVYTPKDPRKMLESMFLQKGVLTVEDEYNKLLSLTALLWNTELFDQGYRVYTAYFENESRRTRLVPPLTKDQIRAFWLGQEVAGWSRGQSAALSLQSVLSVAAGDFSNFYSPARVSTILMQMSGREMKSNASCNTVAIKNEIKREAKKEARKEIHELALVVHKSGNGKTRKKAKKQRQASLQSGPGPQSRTGGGYRTQVLGTGVLAPQLAAFTPKRELLEGGRACLYQSVDHVGTVAVSSSNAVGDILFSLPLSPQLVPATRLNFESQQWEKFQVIQWEFYAVGTQGTTASGQILTFVDPDPHDNWTNEAINLNKAAAQYGAMPKNVWQEWVVALPKSQDLKTTTFYCNPTTNSDTRFTQPGVLRVVNCGGFSGLTTTPLTIYHIYQKATVKFIDPELNIDQATLRPVGMITQKFPSGAPTTSGGAVVTQDAVITTGVPLTVSGNGTITVDTSDIGDNNVVIEIEGLVTNSSDTAPTIAIDSNLGTNWIDSIVEAAKMIENSKSPLQVFVTAVQYLLSGEQSWQFHAIWAGVAAVSCSQIIVKVWTVPRVTTTLDAAHKLGITKRRGVRPQKALAAGPTDYYSSASWFGHQAALTNVGPRSKILDFVLSAGVGNACGINVAYTANSDGTIDLTWLPGGGGEQYTLSYGVWTDGLNPATQSCRTVSSSGIDNYLEYNGAWGATDQRVYVQATFTASGTEQIRLHLAEYISEVNSVNNVRAWLWLSTAVYDAPLLRARARSLAPTQMPLPETRPSKAPKKAKETSGDDNFVVICDTNNRASRDAVFKDCKDFEEYMARKKRHSLGAPVVKKVTTVMSGAPRALELRPVKDGDRTPEQSDEESTDEHQNDE